MNDIECPYCGADQEINHDDGYGYEEGKTHEQECGDCGKNFAYTTSISFYYEAAKADCLNGLPHNMAKVIHYPVLWPDWARCKDCGHEVRGEYEAETNNQPASAAEGE
jgi:DNA-directed RNA polymerase subunit RPC12/RpoP